jgi:hypothetical protein
MAIASVILLIISGTAGVVLTVWGRVMPPEGRNAKRGFVAVGGLSVICIVVAGILNAVSQTELSQTISTMADDVRQLAAPAKVEQNATVDQILSAAAAKLMQQDKELVNAKNRLAALEHPPRDDSGLYQGGKLVAHVLNAAVMDSLVTFGTITDAASLDTTQPVEYKKLILRMTGAATASGGSGIIDRYGGVSCAVVGHLQ